MRATHVIEHAVEDDLEALLVCFGDEVEKDQIDVVPGPVDALGGGGRLDDVVPLGAQPLAERPADQRFVVNNQDSREGHARAV